MKLLEIYESILKFCGFTADDKGFISMTMGDEKSPAFINGLRMVLPTDQQLRSFNPAEKIVFHPLTENILRGESEVIQKLKYAINIKLNFTIGVIAKDLLKLIASPAHHSKLSPEQNEIFHQVKEADEKCVVNFTNIMISRIGESAERVFTNIYLKRGGTYRDKRYSRVGIVTFPFYNDVIKDNLDKVRVKDTVTFRQLFEFMFPNLENMEEYNFGSDSNVAPYMEALLRTAANIASRLNDIIQIYKLYIEEADSLMFEADWLEHFTDLNRLTPEIRRIPVQAGNDGTISTQEDSQTAQHSTVPNFQPQVPQAVMQPQMPMAPAKPEVKRTRRGIDFQSLMQHNQAVAYAPNPLAPQLAQQQYVQQMQANQNRMPSWAAPQNPQIPVGQVVMTPQGPMMMTQQGLMPVVQQPMMQQPMMGGMNPNPTWAGNNQTTFSPGFTNPMMR